MKLIVHFLASALVASVLCFYAGIFNALLFFAGGFLFDIDHYIWWIVTRKSFDYNATLKYFDKQLRLLKAGKNIPRHLLPFHTVEFLLAVLAISVLVQNYFLMWGLAFHFAIDTYGQIFLLHGKIGRRFSIIFKF